MTLFVRRPEQVDAVQVKQREKLGLVFTEAKTWIAQAIRDGELYRSEDGLSFLLTANSSSTEKLVDGDWIVRDEDGDIFKYTAEDLDLIYVKKGVGL